MSTEYSSNPTYAMLCYAMLFVHRTNRNVHWTFKCPFDKQKCPLDIQMSIRPMDEWTLSDSKHLSFLSTGGYAQSYYVIIALLSDAVKVTCPLDIMKCPLDIQKCLFVHRTNRNVQWTKNVQWTFKCPLDILQWYWTCMGVGAPGWLAENIPRKPGFLRVLPSGGWLWQIEDPKYIGTIIHH